MRPLYRAGQRDTWTVRSQPVKMTYFRFTFLNKMVKIQRTGMCPHSVSRFFVYTP